MAGAILGGERRGRAFRVEARARTASSAQESEMSPSSPTRRPAENAAMGASPTDVEAPRPRTVRCSSPAGGSGARVATARSLRSRESPFSRGMCAACGGCQSRTRRGAKWRGRPHVNTKISRRSEAKRPNNLVNIRGDADRGRPPARTSRYQYDRYAWYHTVTCLFRGSTTT